MYFFFTTLAFISLAIGVIISGIFQNFKIFVIGILVCVIFLYTPDILDFIHSKIALNYDFIRYSFA
jgi:NhaP-type Na+/H+ or K+/H+ antiporter